MKLDLHVHSSFSRDSLSRVKQILGVTKRRGIDGIAITDHDVFRTFPKRLHMGVTVIIGSEVKTEIGDLTGLFLTEPLRSNMSLSVIDEIRDQGGLSVLPHPFRNHTLSSEIIEKVDAVEAFNARVTLENNLRAVQLCLNHKKPMIAGSDAHFAFEVGRGITLISHGSSEDEVRKAILKGNTRIEGFQFSNEYLSMMYTMDKIVEGVKNPKNIPSMAFKLSCRIFDKLGTM